MSDQPYQQHLRDFLRVVGERDAANARADQAIRFAAQLEEECARLRETLAPLALTPITHDLPSDAPVPCEVDASCAPGDHTYSWPCDHAPGTGRLADLPSDGRGTDG